MASITLRNIPDDIMGQIKLLAKKDRRSLNQALIVLIEQGLQAQIAHALRNREGLPKDEQLKTWKELGGSFRDSRSTKKIIDDLRAGRSLGRDFSL